MKPFNADQPITNQDILDIQEELGIDPSGLSKMFDLSNTRLKSIQRANPEDPIQDVGIAILYRLYSHDPFLIPKYKVSDLFEIINNKFVNDGDQISYKKFSLLIGREASAGHRLLTPAVKGGNANRKTYAVLRQLASIARIKLETGGMTIGDWEEICEFEFSTRKSMYESQERLSEEMSVKIEKGLWRCGLYPVSEDKKPLTVKEAEATLEL